MKLLRRRPTRRYWIAGALAIVAAAVWTSRDPLLAAAGRWLDIGERPVAVDYVLPLGGDSNSRPFVAAAMYLKGLSPKVVVPRPGRSEKVLSGAVMAHDEIYRQVLLKLGVPERDIIMLDGENQSTFDEARRMRQFLDAGEAKSVAIVTTDMHTRRTRWTFQQVFKGTPHQLHFISAPVAEYRADNWWRTQAGTTAYPCEFAKLVFYWFYYGPGLLCAGPVLAIGAIAAFVWFRSGARRSLPCQV